MHLDENKNDTIGRYLNQQMTDSEVTDFETQLKSSPELAAEVQFWREYRVVVKHSTLFGQVAQIRAWSKEVDGSEPVNEYDQWFQDPPSFWKSWKGYVSGSIGIICLAFLSYFGINKIKNQNQAIQNREVVQIYSKPLPNFVTFEVGSDTTLKKMLNPYQSGDYATAIQIFENNPVIQADETGQLFAGISYLLTNQPEKTILWLNPLAARRSFFHQDKALYYAGLAEIQLGNIQKARLHFNQMPENAFFKTEANQILKKIN
jgi:hypothetical protein